MAQIMITCTVKIMSILRMSNLNTSYIYCTTFIQYLLNKKDAARAVIGHFFHFFPTPTPLVNLTQPGPAQQDFEWGGSSVSHIFFSGGGGGKGFSYSQISEGGFNINKQCVKAQCFYNLKQQRSTKNNGANVPGSTKDYCNLFSLAFELALFRFATPR